MKSYPTVYIICGVHNHLVHTIDLLSSIEKQNYRKLKTIIIDDGSTDGTKEYINKNYSQIKIINGDGNLWWTGAIFCGVEEVLELAVPGDFVLIINNDCTFENDFVKILVNASLEHMRALVGSLIIDKLDKSKIIDAGVRINWSRGEFIQLGPKTTGHLPFGQKIQPRIDTLSTKGTIYPIEVFQEIGNFDKKHLPHYISDYEFACRAKSAGYKLLLSYNARVYNDIKRTGFGENLPDKISFPLLIDLLFSRRSRINIIDHFWFITLCCPSKYKINNYLILFVKCFYLISLLFPVNIFRKPVKKI